MTLLPNSLRGRLLATAAVFIGVALIATGVAVRFALHRFVQGQIDQRLDGQLMTIAAALEVRPDGTLALSRNVDAPPFDNPRTGWFWVVRTPTHTWQAGGLRSADFTLPTVPAGPFDHPRPLDGFGPDGRRIRARADRPSIGAEDVVLIAAAPLDALNGPLRDALVPLFTALLVLGIGLMLATLVQVRLGLQPLARLRDALEAVRTGRSERLSPHQPEEVRPLITEMNILLDQHAANLERARRHVANLAHGLKTPLAALMLALEEPHVDPDHTLRDRASAMERRIRHHLARARIAALGTSARNSLPLASRIADHVAAFGKIYADRAVRCGVSVPAALTVACDPQDFDEMAGNLLDNAFKWARTEVRITARAVGGHIDLEVVDDGPGVNPDQRESILRRGRRLDESVPGDGFGLAIVQEVVELYGGAIVLSQRLPNGLQAVLTLPAGS